MTAGGKKVSRSAQVSISDRASIGIALISLLVSASALWISWTVWKKPPPADPTIIPTFGQSDNPAVIDAGEGGRRFFKFLDEHPGRKVRILAWIATEEGKVDIQMREKENTSLEIHRNCKGCDIDELIIEGKDTAGLSGLQWKSGNVLEGYFANYGLVSHRQGVATRAITPIDIVTAVS